MELRDKQADESKLHLFQKAKVFFPAYPGGSYIIFDDEDWDVIIIRDNHRPGNTFFNINKMVAFGSYQPESGPFK